MPKKFMLSFRRLILTAALALVTAGAIAERITGADFAAPVERYGHFALGRPHEYARLIVTTDEVQRLTFDLPKNEVFEDLAPRIVALAISEPQEILSIVSNAKSGSRLMLLRLNAGRVEISAQSAPIGTPMRWLNPVAVADLDGDGRAEIAAVITPHIGGTLKIYRKQADALVEISALQGFSNHVYGTQDLALSLPFLIVGNTRLLVPDSTRLQLRIIGLENGRLVETGRCALASPVVGPIQQTSPSSVSVGLRAGRVLMTPELCQRTARGNLPWRLARYGHAQVQTHQGYCVDHETKSQSCNKQSGHWLKCGVHTHGGRLPAPDLTALADEQDDGHKDHHAA
jgi:hypothetical protein